MLNPHPAGGVVLLVKVVPGASRTRYLGDWNGRAKIAVAAPAEKGKANEALLDYIAETLGIRRPRVSVVAGHTSPQKSVRIEGVSADAVAEALKKAQR
jgi:uncharacterized protein (TIGR00251 family)